MQEALFFGFSLERHVPDNNLLRKIFRRRILSSVLAITEQKQWGSIPGRRASWQDRI